MQKCSDPGRECVHGSKCMQGAGCMRGYVDKGAPANWDELVARQAWNCRIEGFGLEVRTVLCCPACGAADFLTIPIVDFEHEACNAGAVCRECSRGFRMPTKRSPGVLEATLVQTSGPDLPAWYRMRIPRVGQ